MVPKYNSNTMIPYIRIDYIYIVNHQWIFNVNCLWKRKANSLRFVKKNLKFNFIAGSLSKLLQRYFLLQLSIICNVFIKTFTVRNMGILMHFLNKSLDYISNTFNSPGKSECFETNFDFHHRIQNNYYIHYYVYRCCNFMLLHYTENT